jgi:NADPH:quinone reductase-like Zn-dependent oxidoreductase
MRRSSMKAITQDRYGSADVLEFRDIEDPVVGDDDVLVRVRAAGCGPDEAGRSDGVLDRRERSE